MNFFEAQNKAKKKTFLLTVLFICAVLTLIGLTNILVGIFLGLSDPAELTEDLGGFNNNGLSWLTISIAVLLVVTLAIVYKHFTLKAGGRAIAEMLGGTLINSNTQNDQQKQLLNVVEEMAIASGMAVPPVYLINESSINAFAAGFTPRDAVIGINQGTLDLLNRSELQGVVAHEFSHILNGDMNLNLKLIALLHGIVFIGIIGYGILRGAAFQRQNRGTQMAFGAGLIAIGFGGMFFGNLIKSAVSREREYLADASAVQYTRLKSGIADALKKIGGHTQRSHLTNSSAEQASHMFFGSILPKFSSGLMATHPPLEKRIRAIEPGWDGRYTSSPGQSASNNRTSKKKNARQTSPMSSLTASVTDQVGQLNDSSLNMAENFIAETDNAIQDAAHDVFEARALIYALLLSHEEPLRNQQLAFIKTKAESGISEQLAVTIKKMSTAKRSDYLNLVLLAIPALKQLSKKQYQVFSANVGELIVSDGKVDLFEWVLHRVLTQHLYTQFERIIPAHGNVGNLTRVATAISLLLSILASHSHESDKLCSAAYQEAADQLNLKRPFQKLTTFDFREINLALEELRRLTPSAKQKIIQACALCIMNDGTINTDERTLFQGICATLDCPLPAGF